jgi:hypothetical protein
MDAPSWGDGCDRYVRGAVMLNNIEGHISNSWTHCRLVDECDCLFAMEGANIVGIVAWRKMTNGRIITQLGVCDRYVRSEEGAHIKRSGDCQYYQFI